MARKIPDNFDFRAEQLDPNETIIRDQLGLNVENWARFRYTINVGNDANYLHGQIGPVDPDVKQAYIELGKSHYEVVTSMGCARLSLGAVEESLRIDNSLVFKKAVKDFYFHFRCLLDNLARLIYIVNDPKSTRETLRRNKQRLMRHWVGWGRLRDYPEYRRLRKSVHLKEIRNIRNNIAHSWATPGRFDSQTGIPYWPLAARKKHDLYWHYEEGKVMRSRYRKWIELVPMIRNDLTFLEKLQNQVFGKLVRDIRKFEQNYGVTIQ